MIKKVVISLLGVLAAVVATILILGTFWSRTEHGVLDYKAAIALKLRDAFSGEAVLTATRLREEAIARARTLQGRPVAVARIEEMTIPGPGGEIPIRVYWPRENGPLPVLVYYHGGGWVIGDLDTNDNLSRMLSKKVEAT